MKILTLLSVILCLGLLASSRSDQTTDSPEQLKKVLTGYFTGIENKDTAKMKAVTTDDFVLYENGKIWNNDSAFMNIKRHEPFTVKYKMANFKTYVDKTSGDMTYTNHGDFAYNDTGRLSLDWIESATFRKVGGTWKMNFLQATLKR